jgi:hypothetical protein
MEHGELIVAKFKVTFLEQFKARLKAAHKPGNRMGDVLTWLDPADLAETLVDGARSAVTLYKRLISPRTATAIDGYLRTTVNEAQALVPQWISMHSSLNAMASKSFVDKLTSKEAGFGDSIGNALSNASDSGFAVRMLGRLIGSLAGEALETYNLAQPVRDLDASYERFCSNAHIRFYRDVVPLFEGDVKSA